MVNRKYYFYSVLILGLIARLFSVSIYGDKSIGMEWGEILFAFENFGVLGRVIDETSIPVPNLYMPPLYPMFLILLKFFFPFENNFPQFVLYVQLILSLISIFYLDKLLKLFFSPKISLLGTIIFIFLPINIYCVGQSSSICVQIFLSIMFFFYFLKFYKKENIKNSLKFSIFAGLLILMRGEFMLTYVLTLFFILIAKKRYKYLIISFFISMIIISPYLIRNYALTGQVTITKSFGFNLWKGNNLLSTVEGNDLIYDDDMDKEYKNLEHTNTYDINMDEIYKKDAIKNIFNDPKRYSKLYIKKFLSFMFMDLNSSRPNYYNPFHIFPKMILSILSFISLIILFRFKKNELNYFALYYLYNIALFSIFFILPRYSLMLLPAQIILICFLFKKLKPNL